MSLGPPVSKGRKLVNVPRASHRGCALILGCFGFSRSLIKIFNSYFTGRTTQYKWDSATSADFDFNIRTPQGDCISPILSAIYLVAGLKVAIPLPFPPPNVRSLFFVDDGLLYCALRKPLQNVQRIEACLDRIQDTLATLGLFIEVDKTELIHFPGFETGKPGRTLTPMSNVPVHMRNLQKGGAMATIKPKGLVRYLGFFFDSELNWNTHVSFYFNRAFSTIRALRMLGSAWGHFKSGMRIKPAPYQSSPMAYPCGSQKTVPALRAGYPRSTKCTRTHANGSRAVSVQRPSEQGKSLRASHLSSHC